MCIIWSVVPVLDKKNFISDIYFHGFLQSLVGIVFLFVFIKFPLKSSFVISKNGKQLFLVLSLIIISFLATIVQFEALQINLVSILEVFKRAIGILLALFFGYIFFNEDISRKKILSILVILLGLSLIL